MQQKNIEMYIIKHVQSIATKCFFICIILLCSCNGIENESVTLETPLTIEAIEDGKLELSTYSLGSVSIEYGINHGDKRKVTIVDPVVINLSKGDKIELIGDNEKAPHIRFTQKFYAYGNVMSVLYSTSYCERTMIESYGAFQFMLSDNDNMIMHDSKELFLPAMRLSEKCYMSMFAGCSSLTSAPKIPAKILAEECYESMFAGCTSLTSAPELPATILAEGCYAGMFSECTSLLSAPELPAKRMERACYRGMFAGCSKLSKAPDLPAMQLAKKCYEEMFYNCPNLVEPPLLPATQLERDCYKDMFGQEQD